MARALAPTHDLALVGRRRDRIEQVADDARAAGARVTVHPHDITGDDPAPLVEAAGDIHDLVLAAGLNTPRRRWSDQTPEEFRAVVGTNLLGVTELIGEALPRLRAARGQVVVVSSRAAWTASPGSGVAYRASKSALRAVVDSLNEEESAHGIRACHLCPGDIATEFLDLRPSPPSAAARQRMLSPDDVARAVLFVLNSPPHVRIEELVISPTGT